MPENKKATPEQLLEETCVHLWNTKNFITRLSDENNKPSEDEIAKFLTQTGWLHGTIMKSGRIEVNERVFPPSKLMTESELKDFLGLGN